MPPDQRAAEIAGKFSRYAKTRDESLIEEFTEKDVEHSLIQYAADQRFPHYSAMERRLQELKERRRELLSKEERENERTT